MTAADRAAMAAQAADYEARAQAALEQSHQLHGAALALRLWLEEHPPVEEQPRELPADENR